MDLSGLNVNDLRAIADGRMQDVSPAALKFISGDFDTGPPQSVQGPMPEERVQGPLGTSWKKETPTLRDMLHREFTEGHAPDAVDIDAVGAHKLVPMVMGPRGMGTVDKALGPTSLSSFRNIPSAMETAAPAREALAESLTGAGRGLLNTTSRIGRKIFRPVVQGIATAATLEGSSGLLRAIKRSGLLD